MAHYGVVNPLTISSIVGSTVGVKCAFFGANNSVTEVDGVTTEGVGPPQPQTYGHCKLA